MLLVVCVFLCRHFPYSTFFTRVDADCLSAGVQALPFPFLFFFLCSRFGNCLPSPQPVGTICAAIYIYSSCVIDRFCVIGR